MGIVHHPNWDLSEKGKRDAERHQKKIDDAIRKNVRDAIAEESIITNRNKRKVRVPVRGLKDYKFRYGSKEGEEKGVGQGDGKPGDVIGQKEKDGEGAGKAGNTPGDDYMEVEVDIDYLIKVMFEELGLPWIEEKEQSRKIIQEGWKFEAISRKGIPSRLHKKRTILEAIKRNESFIKEIIEETKCTRELASLALIQTKNDINQAIEIIKNNQVDCSLASSILIEDEDLRYKQIEEDYILQSNAVVIAMLDVSGSMTKEKKFLCRSLLFWMVKFLEATYDNVEIRFIIHTTEAKLVDEETFFHTGECHTEGHYISMGDGSIRDIKDIVVGDKVISINANRDREIKSVTKLYNKKVSSTLELDINGAGKLRCTPDHKYFVFNTNDGNIYEKKAINIDINTDCLLLPTTEIQENDNNIDMFNYVVGFILGDGYIKERSISITDKNVGNLEYLQTIMNNMSISNNIICNNRNRLWIYNKKLCNYMRDNYSGCCELSPYRYINDSIFKLDCKNLGVFISGLFDAEGHVSKKSIQITLSSKKVIKQLYNLLLKFGILSSYTYAKPSGKSFSYEDDKVYYKLQIQGDNLIRFEHFIGFRSIQKKESLRNLCHRRMEKSTNTRSPLVLLDKCINEYVNYETTSFTGYDFFKYIPHRYYKSKLVPRKYIETLVNTCKLHNSDDLLYDCSKSFIIRSINSIEYKNDPVMVYDITVEDNSSYIIDGVYSHNSGGTYCWSAFDKATQLINTEYPLSEWNVYAVYTSDGDDWDNDKTVSYIKTLINKKINMLAYNEVKPQGDSVESMWGTQNSLIKAIKDTWEFDCKTKESESVELCRNDDEHIVLSVIKNRNHIYPVLKYMFRLK